MPTFQLYYSKKQKELMDEIKTYAKSKDISVSEAIISVLALVFYQIQKEKESK
jgi:hypothetical protein